MISQDSLYVCTCTECRTSYMHQFTVVVINKVAIKHNSIYCIQFYKQQYIHILCAVGSIQIRFIPTYWAGDFNPMYEAVHDVVLKHASPDTV
jgi:hypothetical protein